MVAEHALPPAQKCGRSIKGGQSEAQQRDGFGSSRRYESKNGAKSVRALLPSSSTWRCFGRGGGGDGWGGGVSAAEKDGVGGVEHVAEGTRARLSGRELMAKDNDANARGGVEAEKGACVAAPPRGASGSGQERRTRSVLDYKCPEANALSAEVVEQCQR